MEEETQIEELTEEEQEEQDQQNIENTDEDTQENVEPETITFTKEEWEAKEKEIRKEQDERWKDRTMNAIKATKKTADAPKEQSTNEATLARLENRGVMDSEDQAYVLKYAKVEGVEPVEALTHQVVLDRLAQNKRTREQRAAAQPPVNRTGAGKVDDVAKWVARFKKDGSLPNNNPALTSKILDALRNE